MIRPEQAVEARDSLVDTLLQTNIVTFVDWAKKMNFMTDEKIDLIVEIVI